MTIKFIIGAIIILGLIVYINSKKRLTSNTRVESTTPNKFYSLDDGNQDELQISIEVSQEWLDSIKTKYSWEQFNVFDNRMWEYMYKLFDDAVKKSDAKDNDDLWNKLNREQKIFWAFLAFNGDTDNGGVYQFIFNKPEFILVVAEVWCELQQKELMEDYGTVLNELSGKSEKVKDLKAVFNNETIAWEKRWSSFADGYKELKSTEKIEEYYYNSDLKKRLYKNIADRIEKNIDKFATIKK